MNKLIFGLCALTALTCFALLLRSYLRTRHRLLLWSALCFAGLSANNVLLVLDRLVLTGIDLSVWRLAIALVALLLLIGGLVLEGES